MPSIINWPEATPMAKDQEPPQAINYPLGRRLEGWVSRRIHPETVYGDRQLNQELRELPRQSRGFYIDLNIDSLPIVSFD